ncbi:glycosyltransferase [Nesterenkonia populi]|uniref:glycosyltransferase n=1 Tax=Nesterenkonia populi TaxID=1591087 RepID=UPI00147961E2|nr:glycosyltransferase [Nesterenkonia populi]
MAAAASPLFVGHTRFSVHQFGSRYFNATREGDTGARFSEDEYTAWLYSAERLNPRTEIFTELTLPQLAIAAEGFNVVHYVSFSPSLPREHREALETAAAKYSFLALNETTEVVSSTPSKKLIRAAAQKHGLTDGPVGLYRLDDDDVLSTNYFHRMAPYVTSKHIGWWVSQGLGMASIRLGDRFVYARQYYYPKSAFGPLCIAGYQDGEVTHARAPKHTIMDHTNPTILDSREPAYFHIRHRGQDSTLGGKPEPFYPEAMLRIRSQGPADLDQVRTLFPLLADRVTTSPGIEGEAVTLAESTTLGMEELSATWGRPGAMALLLDFKDKRQIKRDELSVKFNISSEGSDISCEEIKEFFASAKVYPEADGTFVAYVPFQRTGLGYLLPLEPPKGAQIEALSLHTHGQEPLFLRRLVAFPL